MCCLALLAALAGCAAGPARPAGTPAAPVLSDYERSTGAAISRDCGYSSPLPGRPGWDLWLFCDTEVLAGRGHAAGGRRVAGLILGTDTAAAGPYRAGQVPGPLAEIPTPPSVPVPRRAAAPEPFLPAPGGLRLPGGSAPCRGDGAYPAAWVSGVAGAPPSAGRGVLLITYDDYCVTRFPDAAAAEGFQIAEYDPSRNVLTAVSPVFGSAIFGGTGPGGTLSAAPGASPLPPQQVLGSPVAGRDGYLYLYGCGAGRVYLARVPAAPAWWRNPFGYQYWTGGGWSGSPWAAASLLPAAPRVLGISAGDYGADGHGVVVIAQTSLSGDFTAWQGASPAGPWRRALSGRVPCTAGSRRGADGLCRALIGHPELSTRGRLLLSFFDPGTGHVDVASYPWQG